jgi:hypothetical protein
VLFDGILSVVVVIVTETDAPRNCIPVSETVFGHGIVSRLAKRIATQDAPYRQYGSDYKAAFLIRLKGIGRASRREPTGGMRFQLRKVFSVELNKSDTQIFH